MSYWSSFNGRLRDELLNETLFASLVHARAALEAWRRHYNGERPHSALGWLTPGAFALAKTAEREDCRDGWMRYGGHVR